MLYRGHQEPSVMCWYTQCSVGMSRRRCPLSRICSFKVMNVLCMHMQLAHSSVTLKNNWPSALLLPPGRKQYSEEPTVYEWEFFFSMQAVNTLQAKKKKQEEVK